MIIDWKKSRFKWLFYACDTKCASPVLNAFLAQLKSNKFIDSLPMFRHKCKVSIAKKYYWLAMAIDAFVLVVWRLFHSIDYFPERRLKSYADLNAIPWLSNWIFNVCGRRLNLNNNIFHWMAAHLANAIWDTDRLHFLLFISFLRSLDSRQNNNKCVFLHLLFCCICERIIVALNENKQRKVEAWKVKRTKSLVKYLFLIGSRIL